jgi:hypothetical protein
MNLNLSVEQLEVISTLLWRCKQSLGSASYILDDYEGDPEEGAPAADQTDHADHRV